MDRIPHSDLVEYVEGRSPWPIPRASVVKAAMWELLYLRTAINAGLDDLYEINAQGRDALDVINELQHRKKMSTNWRCDET